MIHTFTFRGKPIIQRPECAKDTVYFVDSSKFKIVYPQKKDGTPDMRYTINKLNKGFSK